MSLPVVNQEQCDAIMQSQNNDEEFWDNEWCSFFKENEFLCESLMRRADEGPNGMEEIEDDDPVEIWGNGFICGISILYALLRRQDESDEFNKAWGDIKSPINED